MKPEAVTTTKRITNTLAKGSEFSYSSLIPKILAEKYGLSKQEALRLFENAPFLQLLKEEPEFVAHYSPEYWAEEIYEKNK